MKGHLWLGLLKLRAHPLSQRLKLGDGLTLMLMLLFTVVIVTGIYGVSCSSSFRA